MCKLFSRKCRHKFPAFVDEDDFQYCILCGAARKVEIPHKHNWELIVESSIYAPGTKVEDSYPVRKTRTYECTDNSCREVKVVKAT